jgi:hypothetical protein
LEVDGHGTYSYLLGVKGYVIHYRGPQTRIRQHRYHMLRKDAVIEAAGQHYEGRFEYENVRTEIFAILDIHTQKSNVNFFQTY